MRIRRKWIDITLPEGWGYELNHADVIVFPEKKKSSSMRIVSLQNYDQSEMLERDLDGYLKQGEVLKSSGLSHSIWRGVEIVYEEGRSGSKIAWGLLNGATMVLVSLSSKLPQDEIARYREIAINGIIPRDLS